MASPDPDNGVNALIKENNDTNSNNNNINALIKKATAIVRERKEAAAAAAAASKEKKEEVSASPHRSALLKRNAPRTQKNLRFRKTINFKTYNLNESEQRGHKKPKGTLRMRSPAPRPVFPNLEKTHKASHGIARYIAEIEHNLLEAPNTNNYTDMANDLVHIMLMFDELDKYADLTPQSKHKIRVSILQKRGKYIWKKFPNLYILLLEYIERS